MPRDKTYIKELPRRTHSGYPNSPQRSRAPQRIPPRQADCIFKFKMSKLDKSERITVQGRTFDSYDDFMKFMFTQESDENHNEEYDSEEEKREEQTFAIDTNLGYRETKTNKSTEVKYDPSQYYAMMSNQISFIRTSWMNS